VRLTFRWRSGLGATVARRAREFVNPLTSNRFTLSDADLGAAVLTQRVVGAGAQQPPTASGRVVDLISQACRLDGALASIRRSVTRSARQIVAPAHCSPGLSDAGLIRPAFNLLWACRGCPRWCRWWAPRSARATRSATAQPRSRPRRRRTAAVACSNGARCWWRRRSSLLVIRSLRIPRYWRRVGWFRALSSCSREMGSSRSSLSRRGSRCRVDWHERTRRDALRSSRRERGRVLGDDLDAVEAHVLGFDRGTPFSLVTSPFSK